MGCNCDCYCGCDTRPNRLKFLISGALFSLWVVLGFWQAAVRMQCDKNYPAECKQHDAALAMGNGSSQSVPLSCEKAYGDKMECLIDVIYAPFVLFIDVLRLFLLVGFIVPLGMLCCCTKNPHKFAAYHGTQMVPTADKPTGTMSAMPDDPSMQSLEVPMEPVMLSKPRDQHSSRNTSGGSATIQASHNTKDGFSSLLDPQ